MTSRAAKPLKAPATVQPIDVLENDVARYYTHLHPVLVLSIYYLRFSNVVADPVGALGTLLIPLSVLQVSYAVLCLPPTGSVVQSLHKPGQRKKPGNVRNDSTLSQEIIPAILSLIFALNVGTPILAILLVLFGAPLTTHFAHTLLCASHMSLLATTPLIYVHGVVAQTWREIIGLMLPVDEVFGAALGTLLGAWLGAIPIPLDWDREWQKWPVTIVTGAIGGYVLAKKRANDREAQRAIRERTKNQIEALEKRIVELTQQQPYQELQAVLRQKEAIQQENDEIKRRLASVLAIISPILRAGGLNDLGEAPPRAHEFIAQSQNQLQYQAVNIPQPSVASPPETASIAAATPSPNLQSISQLGSRPVARGTSQGRTWPSSGSFDHQRDSRVLGLDFVLDNSQHPLGLRRGNQPATSPAELRQDASHMRAIDPSLSPPGPSYPSPLLPGPRHVQLPSTLPSTCPLDSILLDFLADMRQQAASGAPIDALVGPAYPNVSSLVNPGKATYSHPLSKVFTDILRTFPSISALPEQVAVLLFMFLLMRWHVAPTSENYDRLPEWMQPTPSQLYKPHPAWIDYLPWPRMRDKMISNHSSYSFEIWFIPFTSALSVNWPYDPSDCLLRASDSGDDLRINPAFERHVRDLANWSVGLAFAKAYPHLVETTRIKETD